MAAPPTRVNQSLKSSLEFMEKVNQFRQKCRLNISETLLPLSVDPSRFIESVEPIDRHVFGVVKDTQWVSPRPRSHNLLRTIFSAQSSSPYLPKRRF